MNIVSTCKTKLAHFRIKELKDVLMQLGLSKQGKKQDLVDRILASLSDEVSCVHGLPKKSSVGKERVAKIIDEVYRKLQGVGGTSASANGERLPETTNSKPKEKLVDSVHFVKEIRCPCGSSLPTEDLIQCADLQCCVWQHTCCVIVPEKISEGVAAPVPSPFYCDVCRIDRSDPFWVTMAHPLSPVKLIPSIIPAESPNYLLNVEKTFHVTRADRYLFRNAQYDIQAWCILLNDKVPFRMQWPLYADLKVNGSPVRTVNRPGSQLLGANGRDYGPMITLYIGEGSNQISLSGCDARSFCLGVRLVKQRTTQQILNLILDDQNSEPFEVALARVRRCIGSGMAAANEDADTDLEVIAECVTVNLRCPMSGSRIKIAGRFRTCVHMGGFDLETFVQLNQLSRKWQCPICLKNYSLKDITIDPYFNRIAKMVQDCGEDMTDIDVKPDGSWRAKNGFQFKNLGQWHLPDGSICVSSLSTMEVVSNFKASMLFKEAGVVGHINPEQFSELREMQTSSRNQPVEYFKNDSPKVITMSSSSSESHRDDGDCSADKNGIGHAKNGHEINSYSNNFNTTARTMDTSTSASLGDLNVIVLSDSEEENADLTSAATVSINQTVNGDRQVVGSSMCHSNTKVGGNLVLNPLAFVCADLPLQNLLPTQTSSLFMQSDMVDNACKSNGIFGENFTSVALGSNGGRGSGVAAVHATPATPSEMDLVNQFASDEGLNGEGRSNGRNSEKMSTGPFSFPRKPRSARRPCPS